MSPNTPRNTPRNPTDNPPPAAMGTPADVDEVIGMIEEMIALVAGENQNLARGLPASVAGTLERKGELAEALDRKVGDIESHRRLLAGASPDMRARLFERSGVLRTTIDENVVRLRAAIDANRRRVDAVMRAIREQLARDATYHANGRRPAGGASIHKGVVA